MVTARSALRWQTWLGLGLALCGLGQIGVAVAGGRLTVLGVIGAVQVLLGTSTAILTRRGIREIDRAPEGQTDGGRAS